MPKRFSDDRVERKGLLFVVSAPSGAGKTSLCRGVIEKTENLRFSVSHTTRRPREGEVNGKDYFFVDAKTFKQGIAAGEFIEWAEVHGHLYGTSQKLLNRWTAEGIDVMLDIDVQGAKHLQASSEDGVYIYILPPSFAILKERLTARGADSAEEIARRLQKAGEEIRFYQQYQYLIVNEGFEAAQKNLEAIILAERVRMGVAHRKWVEQRFIDLL